MNRKSILLSVLPILVFLVGLGLFLKTSAQKTSSEPRDAVVTYIVTRNGQPFGIYVRNAKKTGEAMEVRYELNGKESVWFWTADAVYSMSKDATTRQYVSSNSLQIDKDFRSEGLLKQRANFGEDTIAGFHTFVSGIEKEGTLYKRWHSPELGVTPLKVVMASDGVETIVEAVKVEFKPLSDADVTISETPVSFDQIERKIEDLKKQGASSQAEAVKHQIEKMKSQ